MAFLMFGTALAWQYQLDLLSRKAMHVSSQLQPSQPRLTSSSQIQPSQLNLEALVFSLDEVHIGEVEEDNHDHHQVDADTITLQDEMPRITEASYERFEDLGGEQGGESDVLTLQDHIPRTTGDFYERFEDVGRGQSDFVRGREEEADRIPDFGPDFGRDEGDSVSAAGGSEGGNRDRVSASGVSEGENRGRDSALAGEGGDPATNVPVSNKRKRTIIDKNKQVKIEKLYRVKKRQKRSIAEAKRAMYKFSGDVDSCSLIFRQPLIICQPPNLNAQDRNLHERENPEDLNPHERENPEDLNPHERENPEDLNLLLERENLQERENPEGLNLDERDWYDDGIFEFGSSSSPNRFEVGSSSNLPSEEDVRPCTDGPEWGSMFQLHREITLQRPEALWLFTSYLALSHLKLKYRGLGYKPLLEMV
ncbi:uncharacterized protein LOC18014534 [Eutrema salsugineum]|uniref:uncharacterized protein LOC18014534 n=1 Tax=Eutrema salsugineum TaxID=72664 RepID=UPI000CED7EB7|nr:uncharacterized protein LOC18014534 [Eutrema salsugineum]